MGQNQIDIGPLSWADRVIKPGMGIIPLFFRSVVFGLGAFILAAAPLILSGNPTLALQPIILISAFGVSWVSFFSLFIPRQKQLLTEAVNDFVWASESQRSEFLHNYLNYINNDARSLAFSFAAWFLFQFVVAIGELGPDSYSGYGLNLIDATSLSNIQLYCFLASIGIVTFFAAPLAVTGARFLRGYSIYIHGLKPKAFDVSLAGLRFHLRKLIRITGWTGFAYSTGIAVFLFAVNLNYLNPFVIFVIGCVILSAVYPYFSVVRKAWRIHKEQAVTVKDEISTFMLAGEKRLIGELAHESLHRLSEPIVDPFSMIRATLSIIAPIALVVLRSLDALPTITHLISQ